MSSRLRRGDNFKSSFFAFQDIITSVTGILILVTLLLASQIGNPGDADGVENEKYEEHLSIIAAERAELDRELAAQQQRLNLLAASPSPEKLAEDISRQQAELKAEQERIQELQSQLAVVLERIRQQDEKLGLTAMREQRDRIEAKARSLEQQRRATVIRSEQLKQSAERVKVATARWNARGGSVWLVPPAARSGKQPALVTMGKDGITLAEFGRPERTSRLPAGADLASFRESVSKFAPSRYYLVFYLRPSGISKFRELSAWAKKSGGYDIGFDAISEDLVVQFAEPSTVDEIVQQGGPPKPSPKPMTSGVSGSPTGSGSPTSPGKPGTPKITKSASKDKAGAPKKPEPKAKEKKKSEPRKKELKWWQKILRAVGLY
jgi:hypothetical protein